MNARCLLASSLVALTANAESPTCTTAHRCVTLFASTGYTMPLPGRLEVVQDSIVISLEPGWLRRLWHNGGINLNQSSGPCDAGAFATDGRDVVYATSGSLCRVPIGGGAGDERHPSSFVGESRDEIGEVALGGGQPAILGRHVAPIAVAVGPTSVFFIDGHDGDAKVISPK